MPCGWQADDILIEAKSVDIKQESITMPFLRGGGQGKDLEFQCFHAVCVSFLF